MDWGAIATAAGGIILALWSIIRSASGEKKQSHEANEKIRKRQGRQLRRAFRWGDLILGWIYAWRMKVHRHNAEHHPDGVGALEVEDLPDEVDHGIRVYVGEEDEEDEE